MGIDTLCTWQRGMIMRLKDKVAVVTGGASGIGKETAVQFALEGAKVIISDFNAELGEQAAREINALGLESVFIKTDVVKEADASSLMAFTFSRYGKLDILFNCAGVGTLCLAEDLSEIEWDRHININLKGVFLCAKHAIPYLRKSGGGNIINAASVCSYVASPPLFAYNAAKGGVIMATKNMAVTYAKDNIRVNAICPGYIRTPLLNVLDEATLAGLAQSTPAGRLGEPIEIARCVVFLASDEASYVTGTCFIADGGFTCQ